MGQASEYLIELQERAFANRFGFDFAESRPAGASDFKAAKQVSRHFGQTAVPDEILRTGLSTKALMRQLAADIHDDLADCVPPEHRHFLPLVNLGFLPTGKLNAYALGRDQHGEKLDGFVVGINYGLWFVSNLLSEAIVVENLCGDLAHLQRDGSEFFRSAIAFYLDPSLASASALPSLSKRLPDDVRPEVTSYVGALVGVVLTFVALHELAHIVHGDVDDARRQLTVAPDAAEATYVLSPEHAGRDWEMEYAADRYALEGLWSRRHAPESAWANFAQIDLLFRFLAVVEEQLKTSDRYHPPALLRLEALRAHQISLAGQPERDHSGWLSERVRLWRP